MIARIVLCLVLISTLGACSAVPDRYAPWRDDADPNPGGRKPNLGDVPAAPNVNDAKSQIDDMRSRMEADRQNAYMSAQGLVPQGNAAPSSSNSAPVYDSDLAPPSASGDLAPLTTPPGLSPQPPAPPSMPASVESTPISAIDMPAPVAQPAVQQNPQMAGNVYYNYDPGAGNNYTYGFNAPITNDEIEVMPPVQLASTSNIVSSDSSVAIDLSVLGGSSSSPVRVNRVASSGGISTGEPIAYFAHGSAKLGAKDRAAIRSLASQLKQRPQPVMLAGNSSRRTGIANTALSRQINLKMSERRAHAVMSELINQGISAEQIYISAYGDAVPNRREDNGSNEAANRRVEILFDR